METQLFKFADGYKTTAELVYTYYNITTSVDMNTIPKGSRFGAAVMDYNKGVLDLYSYYNRTNKLYTINFQLAVDSVAYVEKVPDRGQHLYYYIIDTDDFNNSYMQVVRFVEQSVAAKDCTIETWLVERISTKFKIISPCFIRCPINSYFYSEEDAYNAAIQEVIKLQCDTQEHRQALDIRAAKLDAMLHELKQKV